MKKVLKYLLGIALGTLVTAALLVMMIRAYQVEEEARQERLAPYRRQHISTMEVNND